MIVTVVCSTLGVQGPASAESLLDAYRMAQEGDPTYLTAIYTLEAVEQKVPEARSALLPQLSATGNEEHNRDRTEFTGSPPEGQQFKQYTWSAELTQPVIQFDGLFAYREAQFVVEQAEAQFRAAKQDLILRVAQAYFDVDVAREALQAARQQELSTSEQSAIAERGYKLGTHAITDEFEARSKAAIAKSERIGAENDLISKKVSLEKLTGPLRTEVMPLQPDVQPTEPTPADSSVWASRAKVQNPLVLAQRAAFDAAVEDIRRNKADNLPTAELVASYGGNYAGASTTNPFDYASLSKGRAVGVRVSVPLFSGGGIQAKTAEAVANRDKADAQLEGARREAAADALQAYAATESGLAQIDALRAALESGQSSVKGNEAGYRLGVRINSDVLNAQQQLFTSSRDLTKARYDTFLQGLKLKAAAGDLTEEDIIALNRLLISER